MEANMSLLESAREMNQDALVEIFDCYSSALYNYAFRLCNDAVLADHIVGDVFAKLLDKFSAGSGPSTNLRSYLYETAYHLIVDEARHSHRGVPIETIDSTRYDGYSAFLNFENEILLDIIMRAIKNDLTKDQRHVIILRFLEGFSLLETAKIIGKEVNYVKVIQNRAIMKLRRILGFQVVR